MSVRVGGGVDQSVVAVLAVIDDRASARTRVEEERERQLRTSSSSTASSMAIALGWGGLALIRVLIVCTGAV